MKFGEQIVQCVTSIFKCQVIISQLTIIEHVNNKSIIKVENSHPVRTERRFSD